MFQKYNHLGFNNPYYFYNNDRFVFNQKLSDLLDEYNGRRIIDPVGVIELLNKNHVFADRTLIQGIEVTPWLAKPNNNLNEWEYCKCPTHGCLDTKEEGIADILFIKICREIQTSIGDKRKVGILLSGGMDSRIVAGALDFLIRTKELKNVEVTGLTWGNEGTRDVVYAKEIASRLGWNWKHYIVTAKDLLNNIKETAIQGCEYSPIHLHAIPQIRDDNNLDIIIAASYGDSVGRAVFSGKKVSFLRPIGEGMSNVGGIIRKSVFNHYIQFVESDVDRYHFLFPERESYMQNELDYQIHYMRRMLNPCMKLLKEKMDFYQAFTHPDVYGHMWSINPERRNNLVYKFILENFVTKLDDIPWAKTGLPYGQEKGKPDFFLEDHHSYEKIIVKEIFNEIKIRVLSNEIEQLKIFNQSALKSLLRLMKVLPLKNIQYAGRIIWLASLAEMVKIYNVHGLNIKESRQYKFGLGFFSMSSEYIIDSCKIKTASVLKKSK